MLIGSFHKQITFLELEAFQQVTKVGSIRAAARRMNLKPSHLSKMISRLERKLEKSLLQRNSSGIILTRDGLAFSESASKLLALSEDVFEKDYSTSPVSHTQKVITIGSVSYLNKFLIAPFLDEMTEFSRNSRYRLLDVPPDQIPVSALRGAFDMVFHFEQNAWTSQWDVAELGKMSWGLFGAKDHPLVSKKALLKDILKYPFVVPTYWQSNEYAVGQDHFPVEWKYRKKGHEASTADTAAQILISTTQLAYLPTLLGRSRSLMDQLSEIKCYEIPLTQKPLYIVVKATEIKKSLQTKLIRLLRSALES